VIHVNLLPVEYRKTEATPVGRFLAIVVGAVLVTSALVSYGYVHYSELKGIREVRASVEAEYANKAAQAQMAAALKAEIAAYQTRRKAIQTIAKARIVQSRKLDEFLDIVHNNNDRAAYFVWLRNLSVKPGRAQRRGDSASGGSWSFAGWAETIEFSRVTNFRDALRNAAFFHDFSSISQPNFKSVSWDDGLEPNEAGSFNYGMTLKPLGWQHGTAKPK
jgi:Tfp pilus assembly protein PilN